MSAGLPQSGALDGFWSFVGDVTSLWGLLGKLAVLVPFVDLVANIGPPWPNRAAVSLLSCVVQLAMFMYVFERYNTRGRVQSLQTSMQYLGVLALIIGLLYLAMLSNFAVDHPKGWDREVIGFEYRSPDIARQAERLNGDPKKLVDSHGSATAIWTNRSLTVVRIGLWLLWIVCWALGSMFVAIFVSLRWRRHQAQLRKREKQTAAK